MKIYGGFWIRFVAYVLDVILLDVAFLVLASVIFAPLKFLVQTSGQAFLVANIAALFIYPLYIIIAWLYFSVFESSALMATPGKLVCQLRVTTETGQRIGFGRATARYFSKMIGGLILCIGFIMAGFTERKRGLHDMMAGTLVMKKWALDAKWDLQHRGIGH